ncbi:MAG: hypothetical protein MJ061_07095, partial [Mailhella sp.]|nr:hypothetical protein [Mailhella sp.]
MKTCVASAPCTTAGLCTPDGRPEEGCPISVLAEAVHERRRTLSARLERAARVLECFLGITAARQAYEDALAPLKEGAAALLDRFHSELQ